MSMPSTMARRPRQPTSWRPTTIGLRRETYNFTLPTNNYIYVACWTDDAVAQGFLAEFKTWTTTPPSTAATRSGRSRRRASTRTTARFPPSLADLYHADPARQRGKQPVRRLGGDDGRPGQWRCPWQTHAILTPPLCGPGTTAGKTTTRIRPTRFLLTSSTTTNISSSASPSTQHLRGPEPGSVALCMGLGVSGLLALRRRR